MSLVEQTECRWHDFRACVIDAFVRADLGDAVEPMRDPRPYPLGYDTIGTRGIAARFVMKPARRQASMSDGCKRILPQNVAT
jgi:hypothetical protein